MSANRLNWQILTREAKAADLEHGVSGFVLLLLFPIIIGVGGAATGWLHEVSDYLSIGFWLLVAVLYGLFWWRYRPSGRSIIGLIRVNEGLRTGLEQSEHSVRQLKQALDLLAWQSTIAFDTRRMLIQYAALGSSSSEDHREIFSEVLTALEQNGEQLFGFGGSERWSFGIYLYSKTADILTPVWRLKSALHPSQGLGRSWRRGEGHVGKAFVNREAIITRDALHPDVAPLSATPNGKITSYDNYAYRSFAAFPLGPLAGEDEDPKGVLVATSDREGRFDKENTNVLRHLADVIAGLVILNHIDVDGFSQSDSNESIGRESEDAKKSGAERE